MSVNLKRPLPEASSSLSRALYQINKQAVVGDLQDFLIGGLHTPQFQVAHQDVTLDGLIGRIFKKLKKTVSLGRIREMLLDLRY
jgi:hypothetical protein